jgi:hypothetical protein
MKVTIDVPDDLYRRVKAKTALQGRAVREVTIELFRNWLEESETNAKERTGKPASWVDGLLKHTVPAAVPGPTAREILEQGRGRLDA